ncbi:MAG: 6-bladed beta-propeller [Marinifilaceae bacterium]
MKYLGLVLIVAYALMVSACNTTGKNDSENDNECFLLPFESIESEEYNNLFEIKDIKTIPLETSDEVLISDNYKLKIVDDNIFILDYGMGQLFRFDMKGLFLNKIGTVGRGPKEIYRACDFVVDTQNRVVEVLSEPVTKVTKYSYEGNYISNFGFGFPSQSFIKTREGYYYFYRGVNSGYSKYRLTYTDSVKVYDELHKDTGKPGVGHVLDKNAFCLDGKKVYLKEILHPFVYSLNQNATKKEMSFDFGNRTIYSESLNKFSCLSDLYSEMNTKGFFSIKDFYVENGKCIAKILFQKQGEDIMIYYMFYDTYSGCVKKVSISEREELIFAIGNFQDYLNVDQFVFTVNAHQLRKACGKISGIYSTLKGVDENDNPVVFIVPRKK